MSKTNFTIFIVLVLILSAIAIPNYGEARLRSNVARTRQAQYDVAKALDAYYVDHRCYPGEVPLKNFSTRPNEDTSQVPITTADPEFTVLEKAGGLQLSSIDPGLTRPGVAGLTTPVAYLPGLPADPFINFREEKNIPLACHVYPNPADPGYIIWSPGPDRTYNITRPAELYNPEKKLISKKIRVLTYFPDGMYGNGNGDIWMIKKEHFNKRAQWSD